MKKAYELDYNKAYDALEIDEEKIPDLSRYYGIMRSKNSSCNKKWGSPERYVNALYWMKFVKHYDWYDMAEILDSNYIGVRGRFQKFGWDNNLQSLEECEVQLNTIVESVRFQLEQIQNHPEVFQSTEYIEKEKLVSDNRLSPKPANKFHVATEKELFKILYYLYIYSEFTPKEIGLYYGLTSDGIRCYIRKFHMEISRKEACARREEKGNGNHAQSRISFNKQVARNALTSGLSNNYELLFRELISSYIHEFFNVQEYEVIVGIQTVSIIPPQEIDIPIIILCKKTKSIYKYAIELNGEIWHEKNEKHHQRDIKKDLAIERTDWKLLTINFTKMTGYLDRLNQTFIDLTRKVCAILHDDIKNYENSWKKEIIKVSQL